MGKIYKTSRSQVRPLNVNDRFVYVLESENPEEKIARELRDFLQTVGYSNIFANFDNIRVGTVHPFAILLAQEVLGQQQKTNIFPSITVVDSTMQEDAEVVADNLSLNMWSAEEVAGLGGYRDAGEVFCSDEGWAKVESVIATSGKIAGITRQYHTNHSIDVNVWSENKEVTSFLFDMVSHFVTQKRIDLHNDGYDMSSISGRRSGDINLDFSKLLYGANVTISLAMNHQAVLFDVSISAISAIDTTTLPTFFTPEDF